MAIGGLDKTCEVQYHAETSDGFGGQIKSWTARATGIKCHLYHVAPQLLRLAGGEEAQASIKVIMEETTVEPGDRLKIGSLYYEVVGPDSTVNVRTGTHIGNHVEVFVREVQ